MNDSAKTGLVLEGGAMRGLFTAGVIDVMMENGIEFDGLIGVSAVQASGATTNRGSPAAFSAIILNMPATHATWACGL